MVNLKTKLEIEKYLSPLMRLRKEELNRPICEKDIDLLKPVLEALYRHNLLDKVLETVLKENSNKIASIKSIS